MQVHHSGYYQWLIQPISKTELKNKELTIHIKELFKDLIASGIHVNKKRVARLMSVANLYGVGSYKRRPKHKAGAKHKAYTNHLQQCFISRYPNQNWVSDITYIRTHEGWIYLATVIALFSRKVIGWATNNRMTTPLVLNAIKMAVHRVHKSEKSIILHSDQGSQYSSYDYKMLTNKYNIIPSMSRRGNCYDNAVAESFFKTLKKELVRKSIFKTRDEAKFKIFEYIEMFYNAKRRHSYLGYISPNEFEKRYNENIKRNDGVYMN